MVEIYKDVIGYEGIYQVSNLGNVKSLKFNKERVLKPSKNVHGYFQVVIVLNCERKTNLNGSGTSTFLPNPLS